MRNQERAKREDHYVRELCWWMKHATGEREETFQKEASAKTSTEEILKRIEPVLDILELSNYELPAAEAVTLYLNQVNEVLDAPDEVPEECYVVECNERPTIFDKHRLLRHLGPRLLKEQLLKPSTDWAKGVWLCTEHAKTELFPRIEQDHGYTALSLLQEFENDGMFPSSRPSTKSLLTRVMENDNGA